MNHGIKFGEFKIDDDLQSKILPIYLNEQKKLKRISLVFSEKDQCGVVKAPLRTPRLFLRDFIKKHTNWLVLQAKKPKKQPSLKFGDGMMIPYLGGSLELKHVETNRVKVSAQGDFLLVHASQSRIDFHVRRWFMDQANDLASSYSTQFAKKLGVDYQNLSIKSVKTRWGSCSSLKNLNYNWRLIFAPETILAYVCAHEVSHLVHMNHSPEFWNVVKQLYPNYKEARAWLRTNGSKLYRFG